MAQRFKVSDFRNTALRYGTDSDGTAWITDGHWMLPADSDSRFKSVDTIQAAFGVEVQPIPAGSLDSVSRVKTGHTFVRSDVLVDVGEKIIARLYASEAGPLVAVNVNYLRMLGEPDILTSDSDFGPFHCPAGVVMPLRVDLPSWIHNPKPVPTAQTA